MSNENAPADQGELAPERKKEKKTRVGRNGEPAEQWEADLKYQDQDPLYDPQMDDNDETWVQERFRNFFSACNISRFYFLLV